jgi:hypothetical protein
MDGKNGDYDTGVADWSSRTAGLPAGSIAAALHELLDHTVPVAWWVVAVEISPHIFRPQNAHNSKQNKIDECEVSQGCRAKSSSEREVERKS